MTNEFVAVACSDVVAEHGEGVVWDHVRREFLWVDVVAGRLHRGRPGPGGMEYIGAFQLGCPLGAVAPRRTAAGSPPLVRGSPGSRRTEQ